MMFFYSVHVCLKQICHADSFNKTNQKGSNSFTKMYQREITQQQNLSEVHRLLNKHLS